MLSGHHFQGQEEQHISVCDSGRQRPSCLNRKGPPKAHVSEQLVPTWWGLFGKAVDLLGGGVLLEEVHPWAQKIIQELNMEDILHVTEVRSQQEAKTTPRRAPTAMLQRR